MKYLKKFESNSILERNVKYTNNVRLIEDFFLDISDTYNIKKVKSVNDLDFRYKTRYYSGQMSLSMRLSIVDINLSNINGCFIISDQSLPSEEKYSLLLKYKRGSLKFPDFGDDVGIFRNRLIDEGFDVDIVRGSSIKDKLKTSDDEIYLEFKISKKESYHHQNT